MSNQNYRTNINKRRAERLRVACQHCGIINKTANLQTEILCKSCRKWAKNRDQQCNVKRQHDKSNRRYLVTYYPIPFGVLVA